MPTSDLVLGAIRRDTDDTPAANGGSHSLFTNDLGRLKVSATPAHLPNVVGFLTSASSAVTVDVSHASMVVVDFQGTYVGVNATFQSSVDGVNWKTEIGRRTNASTAESTSGVVASPLPYSWVFNVNGKAGFRVQATAWVSGSTTVNIGLGAFATESNLSIAGGSIGVTSLVPGTGATSLGKAEDAAAASGDTGIFALAVRNDDAAATPTSATGDYSQTSVDQNGVTFTREKPANGSAITSVASSATVVTLLAAAASRRGATVYNESTATLYLALAAAASLTAYTAQVPPGGYYEVPYQYAGIITGLWSSANGNARVTAIS